MQRVHRHSEVNGAIRSPFGESFYILCREKKNEIFLSWDIYLGLNETWMLYRPDKQKTFIREWGIFTDTKAVFYCSKDSDFMKMLEKSSNFFVLITRYNEFRADDV